MKEIKKLNPFGRFCCTIGNLPSSYMLSLTYEEQLLWLCNYLENTVIPAINNNAEALEEVQRLFVELKEYVENYLDNLDLQEDINNKLDEMAEDGTLAEIINEEIFNELNDKTKTLGVYAPSLLTSVGSEMCTLVMSDSKAVLFDLGNSTSVTYNKAYFESKLGDRKVDAVVLSHFHGDHMGGIEGLADLYADDVVFYLPMNFINYFNGTEDITPTIAQRAQVLSFLTLHNISYYEVDTDRTIDLGDFTIDLTGSTDSAYTYYNSVSAPKLNAYSMNALVKFGESKILFPGDSTIDTQNYLVANNDIEKVNIYCSTHHGYERELNTLYQKTINPDYEFLSVSPLSWNNIYLTQGDSVYRDNPKYQTQAEGDVEYVVTKNGATCTKGNFVRESLFYNKIYEVYVDPNYSGIPLGTKTAPYKSIAQVLTNYKDTGSDITIKVANGTYSNILLKNLNNRINIVAINEDEVTFTGCQIIDCYDIIFNGIIFDNSLAITGGNAYFNNCTFKATGTTSGNVAVSLTRAIAQFYNSDFINCYTGLYANLNNKVTSTSCTFNCSGYAVYAICSYVSLTSYTLTSGVLRSDQGSNIQTITRGNSANRPSFNNSNHMQGYMYFDQTLGKPIFYKNSGGADGWVDSEGNVV